MNSKWSPDHPAVQAYFAHQDIRQNIERQRQRERRARKAENAKRIQWLVGFLIGLWSLPASAWFADVDAPAYIFLPATFSMLALSVVLLMDADGK